MMMITINKILFYGTVNRNFNSFVELGRISQTFAILFYSDINNISAPFRYQANIEIWDQCLSIRAAQSSYRLMQKYPYYCYDRHCPHLNRDSDESSVVLLATLAPPSLSFGLSSKCYINCDNANNANSETSVDMHYL